MNDFDYQNRFNIFNLSNLRNNLKLSMKETHLIIPKKAECCYLLLRRSQLLDCFPVNFETVSFNITILSTC